MHFAFSLRATKFIKIFCTAFLIMALCVGAAAISVPLKNIDTSALKTVILDAGHGGLTNTIKV